MKPTHRYIAIWFATVLVIILALSFFAHVAFIFSLSGLAGWAAFGHLITLDDDAPESFSNPEGLRPLWRRSLLELVIKFLVFAVLIWLAFQFPALRKYGS
jgi:hypothetical protein